MKYLNYSYPLGLFPTVTLDVILYAKALILGLAPDEKDNQVSQIILESIARLLLGQLRGEFA